jgi:branched-chain amino acid transport system substrate-binding protein
MGTKSFSSDPITFPYESNRIISGLFLEVGGQVLDEMYVPLEPQKSELSSVVARIGRVKPDVIYILYTLVGGGIAPFCEAFGEGR